MSVSVSVFRCVVGVLLSCGAKVMSHACSHYMPIVCLSVDLSEMAFCVSVFAAEGTCLRVIVRNDRIKYFSI